MDQKLRLILCLKETSKTFHPNFAISLNKSIKTENRITQNIYPQIRQIVPIIHLLLHLDINLIIILTIYFLILIYYLISMTSLLLYNFFLPNTYIHTFYYFFKKTISVYMLNFGLYKCFETLINK